LSDPELRIAPRLLFNCSPKGEFLGLKVDGRKVSFAENVFYEFRGTKIVSVWSVLDKVAIEAPRSVAINGDAIACGGGIAGPIHY
jgi:predicted ester cyclase